MDPKVVDRIVEGMSAEELQALLDAFEEANTLRMQEQGLAPGMQPEGLEAGPHMGAPPMQQQMPMQGPQPQQMPAGPQMGGPQQQPPQQPMPGGPPGVDPVQSMMNRHMMKQMGNLPGLLNRQQRGY